MKGLAEYGNLLGAVASTGLMLIWLIYLQLFVRDHRSRRWPRLLVQQGPVAGPDQQCSLINMSTMHMDILGVLLVAHTNEGQNARPLYQPIPAGDRETNEGGRLSSIDHGPLPPGGTLTLGLFRDLARWAAHGPNGIPPVVEIRVVFFHGMWDRPQGASRTFDLTHDAHSLRQVKPRTLHTLMWTTRRQRKEVEEWYRQLLNDD